MNIYNKVSEFIKRLTIYDYVAVSIFLAALVIRLAFYQHCLWVDEARDLEITRNFIQTGKQLFLGQPYLQHPIMNYILLAVSTTIFRLNVFGGTIVSILLGSLTVLVVYGIGKEAFNKKVGIFASLLMLIQPLYWFYSERILNDVPNTFFFMLSIYLFVKYVKTKENKLIYLTALVTAFAVLTRISSFVLLPIILAYILLDKETRKNMFKGFVPRKTLLIATGIFLLIFSLSLVYNYAMLGKPIDLSIYSNLAFKATLDAEPWWYYFVTLPYFARFELTILFIIGAAISILNRNKYSILLLIAFLLFLAEISVMNVKVDRYVMPAIPIFALFGGYFLTALIGTLKKYSKWVAYVAVFVILGWTLFSFYNDGSGMITSKAEGFCGLDQVGTWIKNNVAPSQKVMAGSVTILGFYSEREDIESFPPTLPELELRLAKGDIKFLEVDVWERTQPQYIFEYVTNNSELKPVNASLINNQPASIIYEYVPEMNNTKI